MTSATTAELPARRRGLPSTTATISIITAIGLVLRLVRYLVAGPRDGVVGYDDGVYFGGSVRMVHGAVPYRDFVFVHPPVITELMAPLTALSPHVSTVRLVLIARIVTAFVGAATVALMGRLLRHRGTAAVAVGCGIVALHASGIATTRAVLLEPYLAFFATAGLVVLFDKDEPAGPKRTFWGAALLGVAVATKIWALAIVIVVLALSARDLQRLWRLAAGFVVGVAVPCLPFVILSPHAFWRDVVVAQLGRTSVRSGEIARMAYMLGMGGFEPLSPAIVVLVTLVVGALLVVGYWRLWQRHRPTRLELVAVAGAVMTLGMFYYADIFFWHYGGYVGPFLGLLCALPFTGVQVASWTGVTRGLVGIVTAIALIGFAASAYLYNTHRYWSRPPVRAIDKVVPTDSCVLTDNLAVALAVDRLSTSDRCPVVVDPFGTGIVYGGGKIGPPATQTPRVRHVWFAAVAKANVMLLKRGSLRYIPWKELRPYVMRHFRKHSFARGRYVVYVRR